MWTVVVATLGLASADWSYAASHRSSHTAGVHSRPHGGQARERSRRVAGRRVLIGDASIYAARLRGRLMADGTRFDPASNAAASKTLPLGTAATVTNLANGRSTVVEVRDRGPYVRGRILDLSPRSGRMIGMRRDGVARVAILPQGTVHGRRRAALELDGRG